MRLFCQTRALENLEERNIEISFPQLLRNKVSRKKSWKEITVVIEKGGGMERVSHEIFIGEYICSSIEKKKERIVVRSSL